MQDAAPLTNEGHLWGCEFGCGFRSRSFEHVAQHEQTCRIKTCSPGDAGLVENVRHARFALSVSTSCRQDQPGRKVRSTSCEAVMSPSARALAEAKCSVFGALVPHPPKHPPHLSGAHKSRNTGKSAAVNNEGTSSTSNHDGTSGTTMIQIKPVPPSTRRMKAFRRASCQTEPGPSKLKLKLSKVVTAARRANKLDLVSVRSAAFDSLRESISQLSSRVDQVKNAAAALSTARKEMTVNDADSSLCSAASTENEFGENSEKVVVESRVGLKMSRWASKFAARRSPHVSICINSCVVRGPLSSAQYSRMSSRRRRTCTKPRYLDDGEPEQMSNQIETDPEEARTPQQRYLPGIGVMQVVVSKRNGKAMRLHEEKDSDRPAHNSAPASSPHEIAARSEAETSWLVIAPQIEEPREPAPPAPTIAFRRSAFRRRGSA